MSETWCLVDLPDGSIVESVSADAPKVAFRLDRGTWLVAGSARLYSAVYRDMAEISEEWHIVRVGFSLSPDPLDDPWVGFALGSS